MMTKELIALNSELSKVFPAIRVTTTGTSGREFEMEVREDFDSRGWLGTDRIWKGLPVLDQVIEAARQEGIDPYSVTQCPDEDD